MKENKEYFPPMDEVCKLADLVKELLIKRGGGTKEATGIKNAIEGAFSSYSGAWGLCMEENVLREIEALDDAFGVSPKTAYKAVQEMVKRRKAERERFFSTISNGESFRKAFEIYDI